MKTKTILFSALAALGLNSGPLLAQQLNRSDRLVVHEWGTFTVLQDEAGRSIPGVNINEESLPEFVHRLADGLAPDAPELGPLLDAAPYGSRLLRSKGVPRFYPAVTMRMETPILYFHPPAGAQLPLRLDVAVAFRRGWISEWYPHADIEAPGFKIGPNDTLAGHLGSDTVGEIHWNGLQVGVNEVGVPATSEHVWLAPREVPSATVRNEDGEKERYLFYRGVANLEAPLRVVRDWNGQLQISPNPTGTALCPPEHPLRMAALWLTDIRADGTTAFRELGSLGAEAWATGVGVETAGTFPENEYRTEQRTLLRDSMRQAVMAAGLYAAEADALLNTWEASYFKTPGLRLFFLVPRAWTDAVLPLTVSRPAAVERVMIGRIELVTPPQRALLRRLATLATRDISWFTEPFERIPQNERAHVRRQLLAGERSLADLGIHMPESYRAYLALGRFRDALVLNAIQHEPASGLNAFADAYGLRYFQAAR